MPNNNPANFTGREKNQNSTTAFKFPSETPKYYTRVVFHEYNRQVSSGRPQHRPVGSIILPVPENVSDNTNINISNADLEAMMVFANYATKGSSALAETLRSNAGIIKDAFTGNNGDALAVAAALTPGITDAVPGVQRFAEVIAGTIRNPHTTAMFSGVELKTFQFQWKLAPRSLEEANQIRNIAEEIKFRAHPSYRRWNSESRFALDYPELVTVNFPGTLNLPLIRFSFVESVSISNFPSGPSFFRDGMPTEIDLNITLRETDIQTKDDIRPIEVQQ